MELSEAVRKRKSIRAFKPDAVPKSVLREILELAMRAPSWSNTQPWQFVVATGDTLNEIKRAFLESADGPSRTDFSTPTAFEEPYDSRRRANGAEVLRIMGISREDREKRWQWTHAGLGLFGAPAAIYILTSRSIYHQAGTVNVYSVYDCGAVAENILLLAAERGLGTITEIQAVRHSDILRKRLGIDESSLIVMGIAIGYPDWDKPINGLVSERAPIDSMVRWVGFD